MDKRKNDLKPLKVYHSLPDPLKPPFDLANQILKNERRYYVGKTGAITKAALEGFLGKLSYFWDTLNQKHKYPLTRENLRKLLDKYYKMEYGCWLEDLRKKGELQKPLRLEEKSGEEIDIKEVWENNIRLSSIPYFDGDKLKYEKRIGAFYQGKDEPTSEDIINDITKRALFTLYVKNIYQAAKEKKQNFRKLLYILRKINFPLVRKKTSKKSYILVPMPVLNSVYPDLEDYWRYDKNYKDWLEYFKRVRKMSKSAASHHIRRIKIVPPYFFEIHPPDLRSKLALRPCKSDTKAIEVQEWPGKFPLRGEIIKKLRGINWNEFFLAVKNQFLQLSNKNKKRNGYYSLALKEMANFMDWFIKS